MAILSPNFLPTRIRLNFAALRLTRQRFKPSYERSRSLSCRCSITAFPQIGKRKKLSSCGIRQRASATKREQALLAAAEEANILELFVPTFFHQLPVNLPVTQLDDTNSSRYTYDSHYHTWCQNPDIEAFELNYLEIQPIVVPAYENIVWDEQGEVIPGISTTVVRRIPTRNLTWLKSIVENYGKEFFEKFAIFCDDWHIWDLRTPEVEFPIILDWMSD